MKQITINDYHIHYNDLISFLDLAETEKEYWKKCLFIRQIILKSCFAIEALINQILTRFSIFRGGQILFDHFEKLPTYAKIISLHSICKELNKPLLEKHEDLYSQIKELFKIRNDWVHGKGEKRLDVIQDGDMGWSDIEGKDLGIFPKLEIPKGINYNKATKIPINPFELSIAHGRNCLKLVDSIEERIINNFNISKDEIHSLALYDETGEKIGIYPINMVWGAYSPEG